MADDEIIEGVEGEYPAGALVFRTLPHAGSWTPASTGETYVDLVVVKKPTKALVRDAGHAHAAGVIEVLQGLDLTGVQSQEEGEAAYDEAVASGGWQEGQDAQALVEELARERGELGALIEVDGAAEEAGS